MDELEKATIEAAANALLAPGAKVIGDIIGVLGGDALAGYRERKRARRQAATAVTVDEARRLLEKRGINPDPDTPPEWLEDIAEATQDNSIPELRDLFARLAAAAVDKSRQASYRREFVGIVKGLEPIDTLLLKAMSSNDIYGGNWSNKAAEKIERTQDEVIASAVNLERLGLLQRSDNVQHIGGGAHMSALGREFMRCVND
jgi:hypothetical protein